MLHHQEINALKVGGPNLQNKEQIGGGIFLVSRTYSIQQILLKQRPRGFHFQVSYKESSTLLWTIGIHTA